MAPIRMFIASLTLTLTLAVAGCDGGEETDASVTLGDDDDGTSTPTPTEQTPTCGPQELCSRTIDDCAYPMDEAVCTGWYDEPSNCADMDAYIECNCDCVEQDTCEAYFSCGEVCFADHC
jgi:hypothetical protein